MNNFTQSFTKSRGNVTFNKFLTTVGLLLTLFFGNASFGQTYTQVTTTGGLVDGVYLIVGDSTNDGVMVNTITTGTNPFINFSAITNPGTTITSGVTSANEFQVTVTGSVITIYNASVGYVSWGRTGVTGNAANFFNGTAATTEQWTVSVASGLWTLSNVGTAARLFQWNSASPRFASYTSAQVKLKLYKKTVAPTVTTTAVSSIATTTASSGGNVTADGGASVSARGVAFGTVANPTTGTSDGTGTGTFTSTLTGLSPNTQYYYRAFATNSVGTGYGTESNFYTLANVPGVLTVGNPQTTTLDVTVNATTQNSNPTATEYAIHETSTGLFVQANGSLGASAAWQTAAVWGTKTVTGLTQNTTYTFESKARNNDLTPVETSYGATANGTTLANLTPGWCNLQWPYTQTMNEGSTFDVYSRVYASGITNSPGQGLGLNAWIGYSTTNGTPDNTWTWVPASYFGDDGANNDEYKTVLGAGMTPGTYYYVSRFQIGSGSYVYGGKNGNFWASNADSGVLTINSNLVDWCNIQTPTSGSIVEGGSYNVYAKVYEPGVTNTGSPGAGITAWIGYNTSNVNPSSGSWMWVNATFNADQGNDDEYVANIATGLTPNTYYYTSRFQKAGSTEFVYGGTNGTPWTTSGVLTVTQAVPVVTAGSPTGTYGAAFTYNIVATNSPTSYAVSSGTLPAGLSLNTATGEISGTPTAAGSFSVDVTATNSGGTSTPATLSFAIAQANQTITFGALSAVTTAAAPFALTGTASSALTVTYASSNTAVATVSGNTITIVGAGTTTITASQTGDSNYNAATPVNQTLTVYDVASQLAFVGVPATGNVGVNLTSFTVEARRPDNSVDTFYTGNITISKATPATGTLSGTVTVAAVAGVATFSTAQFNLANTYTLNADSGSLPQATSGNVVVTLLPTVIAQFDFTNSPYINYTTKDANVGVSNMALSAGTITTLVTSGTDFPNEPYIQATGGFTATTQAAAKNFNFTITANTGYKIEVTSFQFNSLATAAGPSAISYDLGSGLATFTANAPDTVLLPVNQTITGVSNVTALPVKIQGWLNGSRTSAGSGNLRIDDVIVKGYVTCVEPIAYNVTGGGVGCANTGAVIGLSGSQVGISYQLKDGATNVGSPVAGTGAAISFPGQTTLSTYTVEATNVACSLTLAMNGSATVTGLNPIPTLATVTATPACENTPSSVTMTGLLPSTAGSFFYTNSMTGPVQYPVSGTSDASGNFTFSTPNLPLVANGAIITIVSGTATATGCTTTFSGKTVAVVVNPIVAASVSAAAAPSNVICDTDNVTFTATPTNGGTTPTYQWKVNGVAVSGANSSTYATNTLVNGDVVTVEMTSNAPCATGSPATSTGITITVSPNEWVGNTGNWNVATNWSCNLVPTITTTVVINTGVVTIPADAQAKSLTLTGTSTLLVTTGNDLTVAGALDVASTASVTIENNANLLQNGTTNNNVGTTVSVKRNSSPLFLLDYTMWSSPTSGTQTLANFSPQTATNRYYTYNENTNAYVGNNGSGTFTTGKGYLVRMPTTSSATVAASYEGIFVGKPNSGDISYTMAYTAGGYNAVGNPYPSAISVDSFIADNSNNIEGTLWFWRKTNSSANPNSYCTLTAAGSTLVNSHAYPDADYISSGQGFIVKAKSATDVNFTNSMRAGSNTNEFFRGASKNRFWLELKNAANVNCGQKLIAYLPNTTTGYDNGYDGLFIGDSQTALLSVVEGRELVIQARPAFNTEDVVPLLFKTNVAGAYSVSLSQLEGIFNNGQDILLRDNQTGTVHNLSASGAYGFSTEVGSFASRFEVLYQNALSTASFNENSVVVYNNNHNININSGTVTMDKVKVFDVRGRLIIEKSKVNSSELVIDGSRIANQVLLLQITSSEGTVITKKIVN